MSNRLPEHVDPLRLARQRAELQGPIPVARLERLGAYLYSREGELAVWLSFGFDEQDIPYLEGRVEGGVQLVCQRCLEPMDYALNLGFRLALVASEAQGERVAPDSDALVVGDKPLFLADVIEDELILQMPIVPRHDTEQCHAGMRGTDATQSAENDQQDEHNPFAKLKQLKNRN